jgi:hypothetical protein
MKIKFIGTEEDARLLEKCLDIYLGDHTPSQQYAASILMRMILKDDGYHKVMDRIREKTGFKINDRNSSRVAIWKKKVKKVGKCEICGSKEKLVAHHIVPWTCSIKGRTDIKNGQCLCEQCHKMMHNDILWLEYMKEKYKGRE